MRDDMGAVNWKEIGEQLRQRALENAAAADETPEVPAADIARWRAVRLLLGAGFDRRVTEPLPQWERVQAGAEQMAVLRRFCAEFPANLRAGHGLILTSVPGVGKTQLLALLALEAGRTGASVVYAARGDVLLDWALAAKYRDQHEDYRAALRCDLLLLDDVDRLFDASHGDADKGIPALDALADDRYAAMRSTVVASNRPVRELAQVPGLARSVDRWSQTMVAVALGGKSQRRGQTDAGAATPGTD